MPSPADVPEWNLRLNSSAFFTMATRRSWLTRCRIQTLYIASTVNALVVVTMITAETMTKRNKISMRAASLNAATST